MKKEKEWRMKKEKEWRMKEEKNNANEKRNKKSSMYN